MEGINTHKFVAMQAWFFIHILLLLLLHTSTFLFLLGIENAMGGTWVLR